jgi:hypothetical protein
MTSFQRLLENMHNFREEENKASESKAMDAIRTGINVREDFWDDFLLVINNGAGMSELLGVPMTVISGWHSKVRHVLEKVQQADAVPDPKKRGKLIHTSEEDPFGGGSTPEPPEDRDEL